MFLFFFRFEIIIKITNVNVFIHDNVIIIIIIYFTIIIITIILLLIIFGCSLISTFQKNVYCLRNPKQILKWSDYIFH